MAVQWIPKSRQLDVMNALIMHRAFLSILIGLVISTLRMAAADEAAIHFDSDIRPIFARHCVACHGGVKQASGLSFVYQESVFEGGESGQPAVVPGDVEASYLIDRVSDPDPESRMPPAEHGPPLSNDEIARLKTWIRTGAEWEPPWAFNPPKASALPQVQHAKWCLGPLDYFVLERLESAHLSPSPPAERIEWLRRVSFDLIGLPPTVEDVDSFLADSAPGAYDRVVDRLLASPHFGERWAAVWLDLARYADTTGFEKDLHRDIWPYRDWVIRAFNADMPYDEFTVKQLAGDLLDAANIDDRLATAFHRNTQTNSEGGTDDEEFRIAAVIDRINTTWQVWQATTFGCIQCHSHPYDPFKHEEYYQFMALLDNSRDADVDEDLPRLDVPLEPRDFDRASKIDRRTSLLRRRIHDIVMPRAEEMRAWQNLPIDRAASSGETRLSIKEADGGGTTGGTEVWAEGTVSMGSKFTLESPLPADIRQITALRIDALLHNTKVARQIPEFGFVLTRLKAELLPLEGGQPVELAFKHAFCDEAEPLFDPAESLKDGNLGWASYTRQWQSHFAVFLLDEAVTVAPGSRIRITLQQNQATSGSVALVIGRGQYSVSASDDWVQLQHSSEFVAALKELAELKEQRKSIASISVPVIEELPKEMRRSTFEFTRGLWLDKGQEVSPGTPSALPSLPTGPTSNRLDLARWLVSKDNPLTARVMANRVWEQLFGRGIVETAEDFGTSGARPSHPELLDYLALRFENEDGWSLKKLLREIALSATYRQSARATPSGLAADPQNRLLSRGPRVRLTAEMVRDQALVVSGRFSPKMFGPPVMPPQPDGIWRSVYSDAKWVTATDENRYRRAIYTYWKRTSGYPSFMTFDMPSREVCTARRIATNTPMQALATLNDEAYVECAAGLADRMTAAVSGKPADRIAWAYHVATGRAPTDSTIEDLTQLYRLALDEFKADEVGAGQLGTTPQQAALVVVASAILNLDEMLTK